jgi:hypothetical protein
MLCAKAIDRVYLQRSVRAYISGPRKPISDELIQARSSRPTPAATLFKEGDAPTAPHLCAPGFWSAASRRIGGRRRAVPCRRGQHVGNGASPTPRAWVLVKAAVITEAIVLDGA